VAAKRFPSNCVAGAHTEELQRGPLTPPTGEPAPESLPRAGRAAEERAAAPNL